jgi:hypothetical protein
LYLACNRWGCAKAVEYDQLEFFLLALKNGGPCARSTFDLARKTWPNDVKWYMWYTKPEPKFEYDD